MLYPPLCKIRSPSQGIRLIDCNHIFRVVSGIICRHDMNWSVPAVSENESAWVWRVIGIFFYHQAVFYDGFYLIWRKSSFRHSSENMPRKKIVHQKHLCYKIFIQYNTISRKISDFRSHANILLQATTLSRTGGCSSSGSRESPSRKGFWTCRALFS